MAHRLATDCAAIAPATTRRLALSHWTSEFAAIGVIGGARETKNIHTRFVFDVIKTGGHVFLNARSAFGGANVLLSPQKCSTDE
jgi:hypothetical protein